MAARLLIIADDLTGANDTGVQFAKQGIDVLVSLRLDQCLQAYANDCQVLVVNTESRHLTPRAAFQRVYNLAQQGVQLGIPQFYKKTDSTLRGNVGSELAALLAATDAQELFFAPAYPKLHRTTRGGIQFVKGVPLSQSSFAHDPLNPTPVASIAAIIAQQTDIAVCPFAATAADAATRTIYVIDAETDDDLRRTAHVLSEKTFLAGSAGFAEFLAEVLPFTQSPRGLPHLTLPMLIVNGSLHEASLRQVAHAAQHGWVVIEITPETSAAEIVATLAIGQRVIITTSTQLVSRQVPQQLARLLHPVLAQLSLLVVFGGDTLAAIAAANDWTAFRPQAELLPGVPLVRVCDVEGRLLLTKAGGFGAANFITEYLP